MRFVKYRINLENMIAANYPLFWSQLPLVILNGCIFGVFISLWILAVISTIGSGEITYIWLQSAYVPQFFLIYLWLMYLAITPFPDNVIEYKLSPKLVNILANFIIILLGPVILTICMRVHITGSGYAFLQFGPILLTSMAAFIVYMRADMDLFTLSGGLVILTAIVAFFFVVWVGVGAIITTAGIACAVVFALVRLVRSFRAGRRTDRDNGLILLGLLLPLGGIIFGIISAASDLVVVVPPAVAGNWEIFGIDAPIFLLAVLMAAVWIDLSNLVAARFWLLPKVER